MGNEVPIAQPDVTGSGRKRDILDGLRFDQQTFFLMLSRIKPDKNDFGKFIKIHLQAFSASGPIDHPRPNPGMFSSATTTASRLHHALGSRSVSVSATSSLPALPAPGAQCPYPEPATIAQLIRLNPPSLQGQVEGQVKFRCPYCFHPHPCYSTIRC